MQKEQKNKSHAGWTGLLNSGTACCFQTNLAPSSLTHESAMSRGRLEKDSVKSTPYKWWNAGKCHDLQRHITQQNRAAHGCTWGWDFHGGWWALPLILDRDISWRRRRKNILHWNSRDGLKLLTKIALLNLWRRMLRLREGISLTHFTISFVWSRAKFEWCVHADFPWVRFFSWRLMVHLSIWPLKIPSSVGVSHLHS